MTTLLRAARDESRRIVSDWGVLLITVGAVIIYSFFYPVPYAHEVLRDVPVAVVDQDGSSLSRTLARMLDAHEAIAVVTSPASVAEGEALLRHGTVGGVVVLPRGFGPDVLAGRQGRVAMYVDASYLLNYSTVLKGALESAGTLSAGVELARWRAQGRSADAAARLRQPVGVDLRPLYNVSSGYGAYVVPAVLILLLQQTLLIGAGMAGGTRRDSARPGSEPAAWPFWRPVAEALGRALPYLALYAANAAYLFGFVLPYQGYPSVGRPLVLALVLVPFLLASTMGALALRGLFRRRETAVQVLLFTSLPFIFLGGFSWPTEAIPSWLLAGARLVPTSSAIPAILRVTRMGASLADVATETTTLWWLAGFYFLLACLAERRKVYTPDDGQRAAVASGAIGA